MDDVDSYRCDSSADYTGGRCLPGRWRRFALMNNSNKHIYVACIILKFAIKTIAFDALKE